MIERKTVGAGPAASSTPSATRASRALHLLGDRSALHAVLVTMHAFYVTFCTALTPTDRSYGCTPSVACTDGATMLVVMSSGKGRHRCERGWFGWRGDKMSDDD